MVVWDRIVRRKEDAFVKFAGKNKYMFRDISSSFKYVLISISLRPVILNGVPSNRGVPPANYSLKYNIMPYIGVLQYGEAARTTEEVAFPEPQSRL